MALGFTDMTPEGKRYFAELNKLASLEVCVGFQSGQDPYEDGADLAVVAAINELGSSSTPARPFMRQSFENHEGQLKAACEHLEQSIIGGASAQDALTELGVFCKGLVQKEIVDGGFEPNAPSTIAKKGSEQPLIDTGHMRQSVNYVVREAGSGE
jgi:hypothetical protein